MTVLGAPGHESIYKLPPQRAAEAGRVLAASHANYPVFDALVRNPKARQRMLVRLMGAAARDAATYAHALMALAGDRIVGVALWMSPGSFPPTSGRKARMTPVLMGASAAAPRAMATLGRAAAELEKVYDSGPHWYLQALGVHPDWQGQGIGSELMLPPLRLADAEEIPCHLHTSDPRNVGYYRRFGFEVVDSAAVAVTDSVGYIGMSRPAGAPVGSAE